MYSLFQKEIKSFFGSLIAYLSIGVFLVITGLFLWVFPGNFNIPESGYASLEGLFTLAPWVYLFLVPAVSMRLFAEERRSGTIELLLTHPVSDFKLVLAKFMAGLFFVVISLLPSFLYFFSVWQLGNPVGNMDTGATWGSLIGLFMLAMLYVAIGIFASSQTDNQIVSFIFAMALSFLFFMGFEFISSAQIPYMLGKALTWMSINEHYRSVSRGVIDMRDMVYFAAVTYLFLYLTGLFLRRGRPGKVFLKAFLGIILTVLVLVVSAQFLWRYDLTSDKRFTLSERSIRVAAAQEKPVEIDIYLAGELEPGLRRIQDEILEKVAVLNAYSPSPLRIRVMDPYSIVNPEKRDEFIKELIEKGIHPINLRRKTEAGEANRFIFPGALLSSGGKEIAVNFLKNNRSLSYEQNFNHSLETVEFELVNGLRRFVRKEKSVLGFLQGHGEANPYELSDIAMSLSVDFDVDMVDLEQLYRTPVDVLVVADPEDAFDEKSKFILDQYLMRGGKMLWLIDPVHVSLDSLSRGETTYSFPKDLGLGDQLFTYGVRLNYDLLQDVDCIRIRVNTAAPGAEPHYTLHPWYYSPLLKPSDHPIGRNLNRVMTEFISSVDTVKGASDVKKEIILATSAYSRKVKSPATVSLRNIDNPPARELFTLSHVPVGVLLEGQFASVFRSRMVEKYGFSSDQIIRESIPTKMIVIADGGMIKNKVRYSSQPPGIMELGKDLVSGITFGNRDLLMNAIYYLDDTEGIMELRGRSFQMRLLDKVKLREEKSFWVWLNVALPLLFLALFGLVYNLARRTRYRRS